MYKAISRMFNLEPASNAVLAKESTEKQPLVESMIANKFEMRPPSPQNAVDIFAGRWASSFGDLLPGVVAGDALHFTHPSGPRFVLDHFCGPAGNLAGQRILELGPLEGGHTYALSRLKPENIIAVEANSEAYLKCLISKELLNIERCQFLFGDFVSFLELTHDSFDLIFASGVLYHMPDPVHLLSLIAKRSKRAFFWTHYYTPAGWPGLTAKKIEREGETFTYYVREYGDMASGRFWGGNKPTAALLTRDDLLRACRLVGFDQVHIDQEEPDHPNGPAMSFSVWKTA